MPYFPLIETRIWISWKINPYLTQPDAKLMIQVREVLYYYHYAYKTENIYRPK